MFSTLEVFVHAGPVSLVAMSDLNWELQLLREEAPARKPKRLLSLHVGPIEIAVRLNPLGSRSAVPRASLCG